MAGREVGTMELGARLKVKSKEKKVHFGADFRINASGGPPVNSSILTRVFAI